MKTSVGRVRIYSFQCSPKSPFVLLPHVCSLETLYLTSFEKILIILLICIRTSASPSLQNVEEINSEDLLKRFYSF